MADSILENVLDIEYYDYEELPEWYKDNKYVSKGYRDWNRSCMYYFKSIFKWHNETLNIWSHLIATILFTLLSIYTFKYNYNIYLTYLGDIITMSFFLFSCILCFTLSSIMHCFYPKSEDSCNCLLLCDYYGIIFLILCSYNIFIYYLFYCNNLIQTYYYLIINSLALLCFIVIKLFNKKKYKLYKLLTCIIFILSIFVPIFHRYLYYKNEHPNEYIQEIKFYSISLGIYFLAFLFYVSKIPESLCYHKFNCVNYLTSHTIFHIIIVIATITNYYGILNLHNLSKNIDCKNKTSFY
tara:strand:+ start:930 stop:1817 length:888 start_codon:yes stop_codon:yes gene_type:complete